MSDWSTLIGGASCSLLLCVSAQANAQTEQDLRVGRIVSSGLLNVITNPARSQYRVGILNTGAQTGMRVSPHGAPPVVEFLRGHNGWLWVSAAEQIADSDEPLFQFEVMRTTLDAGSCAGLGEAVDAFYLELERALDAPIVLSEVPERPTPSEITVNGTSFPVLMSTGDNYITISPDRDLNRAFHEASFQLHVLVSGCSNEVEGIIESHNY